MPANESGGRDEEVDRNDILDVVLEKRLPGGRGRLMATDHVLLDGGLGDVDADLAQLTTDLRRSPEWVGGRHSSNEVPHLPRHGRSSRLPRSGQPGPVFSELAPAPGDHGPWLHDEQRLLPARPDPGMPSPEDAVSWANARALHGSLVDTKLVPEGEDLDLHGGAGEKGARNEGEQSRDHAGPSCGTGAIRDLAMQPDPRLMARRRKRTAAWLDNP
jgi:hypothetical protein